MLALVEDAASTILSYKVFMCFTWLNKGNEMRHPPNMLSLINVFKPNVLSLTINLGVSKVIQQKSHQCEGTKTVNINFHIHKKSSYNLFMFFCKRWGH